MKRPELIDIGDFVPGKIFQISPEGKDVTNIQYGGEFLIGTEYGAGGVMGYLACVLDNPGLTRYQGVAYLRVPWELLEYVGNVEWLRSDSTSLESSPPTGEQSLEPQQPPVS